MAVVLCYSAAGRYIQPTVEKVLTAGLKREKERGGGERIRARAWRRGAWLMMDRSISSSSENASARTRKRTRKLGTEFFSLTKSFSSPPQSEIHWERHSIIWHEKPKRKDQMEIDPPPPRKRSVASHNLFKTTGGVRRMHPSQCRIERKVKPESPWTSLLYPSRLSRSISRE